MICAAVDLYEELLKLLLKLLLLKLLLKLLLFTLLLFGLFEFGLFFLVNGGVIVNEIINFHKLGKSVNNKREISSTFFSLAAFLFAFNSNAFNNWELNFNPKKKKIKMSFEFKFRKEKKKKKDLENYQNKEKKCWAGSISFCNWDKTLIVLSCSSKDNIVFSNERNNFEENCEIMKETSFLILLKTLMFEFFKMSLILL